MEPCLVKTRNRKAIVAKVFLFFVLILIPAIFLAGCSTDQDKPAFPDQAEPQVSESTPVTDLPSENQDTSVSDVVLVSHEANVGNRRLTITAMGLERQDGIDGCGIKILNIFEGSDLIQTINISEAIERDGVSGAIGYGYTEAWDKEAHSIHKTSILMVMRILLSWDGFQTTPFHTIVIFGTQTLSNMSMLLCYRE